MKRLLIGLLLAAAILPASAAIEPTVVVAQAPTTIILVVDDFTGEVNLPALASELAIDTTAPTPIPGRPTRRPPAVTDFNTFVQLQSDRVVQAEATLAQSGLVALDADPETSDNCAVTLQGQVYATRGAGTDDNMDPAIPHGEYVREVIDAEIERLGLTTVEVVEVNLPGFNTTSIVERMEIVLEEYPNANVVVNMSFSIIPCDLLATLATAESYAQQLAAQQNFTALDQFRGSIGTYLETNINEETLVDDAIRTLIQRLAEERRQVIFVGASGNYGQAFSFLPSGWPEVLSVGASTEPSTSMLSLDDVADYSNQAQIMVPLLPDSPLGTSFAAPRLSVLLAAALDGYGAGSCGGQGLHALLTLENENYTLVDGFELMCADLSGWVSSVAR